MTRPNMPTKCKSLIYQLIDNHWSFAVVYGSDTGGADYVTIEAVRDMRKIIVTWHTRATGTYRLFSCMLDKRDVTLTKAMEVATA